MGHLVDEKCDKCGEQKEMYYRTWCPLCERPEAKQVPVLNFLKVVYHLERKYPDRLVTDKQEWASRNDEVPLKSHKDSLWHLISDRLRNDCYVAFAFKSWAQECDEPDEDGRIMSYDGSIDYTPGFELMQLIVDEFDDEVDGDFDQVLWEISW